MSAISLDGAALLAKVKAELAAEVEDLRSRGVTPGLGTILVGDNPSSAAYVRLKHQDCAELGITSVGEHLPADAGGRARGPVSAEEQHRGGEASKRVRAGASAGSDLTDRPCDRLS